MLYILATIRFRPDAVEPGARLLAELATASRGDPGCVSYQVLQRADDPGQLQTVEHWADQAAADAHLRSPHVQAAIAAGMPLFAAPPEIVAYLALG
jgi:quinol monooxygenase YgiN